jgi:hypothetical protein
MKNRFLILALLTFCLASCASYYHTITQPAVRQIRPGYTTEPQLRALFGAPDTRIVSDQGDVNLSWFRSAGPGPASYAPIVGQFMGGFDFDVQQLDVLLAPNGRVRSYTLYDSNGAIHTERSHLHTASGVRYGK